ncbi:Basic juvenile hormone-suppressible protein 2 [Eumeta japonica]|uniref:Basic juvenile hormone-suppressible protein 2 n=1 Tax=Eumeta variegata TaxID=151549 RepID=A0A4C1V0P3_EUMVA|nr:Basic juvenile hormone-suppressible protein 2 [Eumeta japonica]
MAFYDEAPSLGTVCNWFNEFKCGRINLIDDRREGRPSSATTEDNISSVQLIIETDKIVTFYQIRTRLGIEVDDISFSTEMKLVPGNIMSQATHKHRKLKLEDLVDKETDEFKNFNKCVESGHTMKGLTFTLYDDNMKKAAVALFRLFQTLDEDTFHEVVEWAKHNVNEEILEYAWRLLPIFTGKFKHLQAMPRFITKPNYFVNSETISKAYRLKLKNGDFNSQEAKLFTRYRLEQEHLKYQNGIENINESDKGYNPNLEYDNGLPFPYRHKIQDNPNDEIKVYITKTIISIRESIARNFIIVDHGSKKVNTSMSEEVLAKLIRSNIDGAKSAKILRAYYGYNDYPVDDYNPAPSVFHHSETSLRDPLYWHLISCVLKYFLDYKKKAGLLDLSNYETDSIHITKAHIPKIYTYFDYYEFDITGAMSDKNNFMKSATTYTARQKRLTHAPFELNFIIESKISSSVVIRLFLGPQCEENECFQYYSNFFRLDYFQYELSEGQNLVSWSPQKSEHLSNDEIYNLAFTNRSDDARSKEYNMFKFPERLLIPRGYKDGLTMTLFLIVTQSDNYLGQNNVPAMNDSYNNVHSHEIDDKPIGFPFHRMIENYSNIAFNYKFYNITIYHKDNEVDDFGVFSRNLS